MDAARKLAFTILREVDEKGAYSNIALSEALRKQPLPNAAFVRRLVHGVLKNRILLDYQAVPFLKKPGVKKEVSLIIAMGIYQIVFMEDVPDHAAVSESVSLAARFAGGRQGLVNGVLRNFIRSGATLILPPEEDEQRYLCVKYSCSPWIVKLWTRCYGREKAEEMLSAGLQQPPLNVRPNILKTAAFAPEEGDAGIFESRAWKDGLFSVQDGASMSAVRALNPQPGERILDMCAAPGGKSCAMAELMGNKGSILACDIYENRLKLVEKDALRLGIDIIEIRLRDASAPVPEEERCSFDAVLCDVPCSGLGVIRRRPEIKYRASEEDVSSLPPFQLSILKNGAAAVKPGGRIMYSTCTVNPGENGEVTEKFLEGGGFSVIEERQIFPGEEGCDGFYYCLMRKDN